MPRPSQRRTKSTGKVTTSHDQIRKWTESRGGHPATVKSATRDTAGLLRIDFPGYRGKESLKEISWDDFFNKFDKEELAFLYQDRTVGGKTSRFCKFIDREEASRGQRSRTSGKGTRESSAGSHSASTGRSRAMRHGGRRSTRGTPATRPSTRSAPASSTRPPLPTARCAA